MDYMFRVLSKTKLETSHGKSCFAYWDIRLFQEVELKFFLISKEAAKI